MDEKLPEDIKEVMFKYMAQGDMGIKIVFASCMTFLHGILSLMENGEEKEHLRHLIHGLADGKDPSQK